MMKIANDMVNLDKCISVHLRNPKIQIFPLSCSAINPSRLFWCETSAKEMSAFFVVLKSTKKRISHDLLTQDNQRTLL